jgi:hypothetical protein
MSCFKLKAVKPYKGPKGERTPKGLASKLVQRVSYADELERKELLRKEKQLRKVRLETVEAKGRGN